MWYKLLVLSHTNSINNVITFFGVSIGRYFTQAIIINYAASAALHLCVEHIGVNIFHKQHDFQWPDIGACRNQRDSNCNSEILFCSEVTNETI